MSEETEIVNPENEEDDNDEQPQSPQAKQPRQMSSPTQNMYGPPGMPPQFSPGMRPPGMSPIGYRGPMRGMRPMGMRGPPGMRHPRFRGPVRYEGHPPPPYDMHHRGPPRYPPRFPHRMSEGEPNNDNMEGYYDDGYNEDYNRGLHSRRGYGPPGPYMGGPPGPRPIMNGVPPGTDMGAPGFGLRLPGPPNFMQQPRGVPPPGSGFDPNSPNGQGGPPFEGQQGGPPTLGLPPYGMLPQSGAQSTGETTNTKEQDSESTSPRDGSQGGSGPLLPSGPETGSPGPMNYGQVPPQHVQPYGMPPYGPPQGMYQPGMHSMGNGPPPFMQMAYPPMMPSGPMGMHPHSQGQYGGPPPNAYQGGPPHPGMPPGGPYSGHQRQSMHPAHGGPHAPPNPKEDIWIENVASDGKMYYYNMHTRETRWDRPEGVTILRQGEVDKPTNAAPQNARSSMSGAAHGAPPVMPITAKPTPPKPADVAAWNEYKSGDGKPYYHNSSSGQTTWEKPQVLVDWENGDTKLGQTQTKPSETSTLAADAREKVLQSSNNNATPVQNAAPVTEKGPVEALLQLQHPAPLEPQQLQQSQPEPEKEPEQKDTSRPISSTAVTGTPWCVVWTGDNRVFFFNPSKRVSVWETPDELKGRSDVERLLNKPPNDGYGTSDDSEKTVIVESVPDTNTITEADEIPSKRARMEEAVATQIAAARQETGPKHETMAVDENSLVPDPSSMNAAKEAYERAARDQASLPLDVRLNQFREMLIDKQVSAFSTWDKELHKIVFDHRYLLLSCEERKQAFDAYVRERADDERRETKNKLKEKKDKFNELLLEANLSSRSSFSDFSQRYGRDERFKGIEKSRERESLFHSFLSELRRKDKEKISQKDKIKSDFIALLKEQKSLSRHSHWSDVKKKIDSDSRYRAVDSTSRREDWFRDYIRKLDDSSSREDSEKRREREKRERQEASLRERKKEVEETRSNLQKERDREREVNNRRDAESNFNSLLADVIKTEGLSWKEAKKLLRKDSRWDGIADVLSRSDREGLFDTFITGFNKKAKEVFRKMLSENASISYWHSWKAVKETFKEEARFERLLSNEKKWKSEFRDWTKERESKAKKNFTEMLKEKSSVLATAKRQSSETDNTLDDILSTLKEDIRYQALEPDRRNGILEEFLERLSDSDGR